MRRRALDFACWLFGHELLNGISQYDDRDAMGCECGARWVTNTALVALGNEIRRRRWRL